MNLRLRLIIVEAGLGFMAAYGCSTQPFLKADVSPLAIEALDPTALLRVEGCGYQPLVTEGYAYCRVTEGPVGNMALTFIAPPQSTNCGTVPCVSFTIFYPDQSPAYEGSIPAGKTSQTVLWSDLVKKSTFSASDRGFWPYTYTIHWIGADSRPMVTVSEGELRLRVIKTQVCGPQGPPCPAYVPLRNSVTDENFVWAWTEGNQKIQMTTGARTFVSYPGTP